MKLGELVCIRTGRLDANQAVKNGRYPFFTCAAEPLRIDDWQYDCECVLVAGNCNPYVSYYNGKFNAYQRVYIIEVLEEDRLYAKYLYYFLKLYMERSTDRQHGAIEKFFHLSDFTEIDIDFPSVEEQRLVADSLWTIDRKIALNRKRIATLEAMAKEIYDYWFVQFDFPDAHGRPYKSSGGAMVYNPDLKREIPKGWEVGVLPDIVEFTNGLACQRFRPQSGERSLPVLKIKEMHDGITDQTERVKEDIPERFKVYDGDVVFSWSASLEVMVWFHGKAGLNQHIFKVTEKDGWPIHFSYFLLSDYIATFRRIAESRKTTMGHITSDHLRVSTVPLPQHKVVAEKFEEIVRPIFDVLVKAAQEVSNLVNMRDFLLPLLMNGQVKVGCVHGR